MLEKLLSQHQIDVSNIEVTGCFYHLNTNYETSKTIEGIYRFKPNECPYCTNQNSKMFKLYKYQTQVRAYITYSFSIKKAGI